MSRNDHCKKLNFHVKMFDTNSPVDTLVDNAKFPEHDIFREEHLSDVDIVTSGMFGLKYTKDKSTQVSWVTKNQLLRSSTFLEAQFLDVTCKKAIRIAH